MAVARLIDAVKTHQISCIEKATRYTIKPQTMTEDLHENVLPFPKGKKDKEDPVAVLGQETYQDPTALPDGFRISPDATQEINAALQGEQHFSTRFGKWIKDTFFKKKDPEHTHQGLFSQRKHHNRYGREATPPAERTIDTAADEFVSDAALSEALGQSDSPVQLVETDKYVYALVRTDKMERSMDERETDQIAATMRITRAGRPSSIANKRFGRGTMPQQYRSPEARMKDAEQAGFGIYRVMKQSGGVGSPDEAVFERVQPPLPQAKTA